MKLYNRNQFYKLKIDYLTLSKYFHENDGIIYFQWLHRSFFLCKRPKGEFSIIVRCKFSLFFSLIIDKYDANTSEPDIASLANKQCIVRVIENKVTIHVHRLSLVRYDLFKFGLLTLYGLWTVRRVPIIIPN